MRRGGWITLGLALAGALLALVGVYTVESLLSEGRALAGVRVGDRVPPPRLSLREWLELRKKQLRAREAYLCTPEAVQVLPFSELGLELDVEATLASVLEYSQHRSLSDRLGRALAARRDQPEIPLRFQFDERRARSSLEGLAPIVQREPVDARLDLEAHRRVPEQPGRELDVDATLVAIARGSREEGVSFALQTRSIPARVTLEMLAQVDVSQVLGAFESDFGGTGAGRARNIARAARYLNGTLLSPGQVLSFNRVVGPRRVSRGFTWAPVIVEDEFDSDVGGGVCQVASTLHAAAVYGALEIVERRSHSRPIGYVPLGLDAVVIEGKVDLKIKNNYESLLMLHAFLADPTRLRVEILGRPSPGRVEHTYSVVRTLDFYRRVTVKPELKPDQQLRRQKGRRGYDVLSLVRIADGDGQARARRYLSHYYPVPEVFWVGPGASLDSLPDLPEGALGVEVEHHAEQEVERTQAQ